ncbi:MAG TPA: peptide chain release factor N(5)-glutamine methyltransferase [Vicinamibacterales bacterium]|jgi:release factor glutamine methyltransferase|nr:peptide chain release factor N(5)-glutamine methyltransferase [Vicinamibacterales bacterium]
MTLAERLAAARTRLSAAGISSREAANDAELLARHALHWDRARIFASLRDPVPPDLDPAYENLIARRATREPASQIIGVREFFGREFEVGRDVLTPRPETELIVEEAVAQFPDHQAPLLIADVGTGSGCLAITLALEFPRARIVATDISAAALDVARRNAARHDVLNRIDFVHRSGVAPAQGLDLVVSNPPYVPATAAPALPPEVRDYEPPEALFGGEDGLSVYRLLLEGARDVVAPRGRMILELGYDQVESVSRMAERDGWAVVGERQDLQGITRVLTLTPRRRV